MMSCYLSTWSRKKLKHDGIRRNAFKVQNYLCPANLLSQERKRVEKLLTEEKYLQLHFSCFDKQR